MNVRVLKMGLHGGEEPVVKGNDRSGLVVFSGCHLACSFCYTPETSVLRLGTDLSASQFAQRLQALCVSGARNIGLISPSHVWDSIEPVLVDWKKGAGAAVPLILKNSGFESPHLIRRFAQVADVFVPDFKVWDPTLALSVRLPARYGEVAKSAFEAMLESHGTAVFDQGKLVRGIVARHLLMPGFEEDSVQVIAAMHAAGYASYLNLMTHFIDGKGHLVKASQSRVAILSELAQQAGMQVLVDGLSKSRRAA